MLSDGSWVCADCIENGKAEKIEENIKKVNKLKVEQKQKMEEKKDFMDKYWKWMAFIMISLVLGVLFDTGNISVDASSGAWAAALTFVCLSIVEKIVTKPRKEFVIMGGCIVSGFVGAMAFTSNQHTAMGQPITWQIAQRVSHLAGLPLIDQRRGESGDQAEASIRRLQQYRTAVRTGVGEIEDRLQRAVEKILEQQTRCRGRVAHVEGLLAWRKLPEQVLSTMRRPSCSRLFMNSAG